MATQAEELQVREFLKRAEVRTMRKDLQALREVDALKERYKIVNIKTLEEQQAEQQKKLQALEQLKAEAEKAGVEKVLGQNANQERIAEKDLKNYATEQERQQIFLLESQRLEFEKQTDAIDKEKDPALKLEKNKTLLQRRDWEAKLSAINEDNRKLDTEENFLNEKIAQTQIAAEKKGLEERRWEIEDKRKEIEKKIWEVEKQQEAIENKLKEIDKNSELLVLEKNKLRDEILGIDKSLRDIYSAVMAREEERRSGMAKEQVAQREKLSKVRAEEKEKVQRQQWTHSMPEVPIKKVFKKSFEAEEEQRKKFIKDVEQGSQINFIKK